MILQSLFYGIHYLLDQERLSLDLVTLDIVMPRIPGPEPVCKLAAVQFADQNPAEARKDLSGILRKRVYIIEMHLADSPAGFADLMYG